MAVYSVNEEGVEAMRTMAGAVRDAVEEIAALTEKVQRAADGNQNVLGPHKSSLDEALEAVRQSVKAGTEPAEEVAEALDDAAEGYEEVISSDRLRGGALGGIGAALGSIFGGASGGASGGGQSGSKGGAVNSKQSISGWIQKVNPHYGNPFFPQSSVNCGACALAVEKRLNGDKTATASLTNIGTDAGMEAATGKKCVYMSEDDVAAKVKSMGAGAHVIAGVNRRLPNGNRISGHWFNIFYDGNKLYVLDGQSGNIYDWPHDYQYVSEWCVMI